MKRTFILAALLLAACGIVNAQGFTTLGIGINNPQGTLHVHNPEYTISGGDTNAPGPIGDGDGPRFDPPDFRHSRSSFHLTNYLTGVTLSDGFVIDCNDYETTLRQMEDANLTIKNHSAQIILSSNGKVGVGTVNNSYKFNVDGSARVASLSVSEGITCQGGAQIFGALAVGSGFFYGSDGKLTVGNGFSCTATGELKVKSLRVTTTAWPDYVFGGGHKLMPLQEVEDYIEAHGHLPEIPSAEEAEADGVDLGEMNKLLLQKVEELTLYVIDLQKQVEELKSNK